MSFVQEESDAVAAAFHTPKDQIVRLEGFLRIFDRALRKAGVDD